ncbi:MAG: hypothetical protein WBQ34_18410 [Candidatus Acidiferrales bacterium]
MMKQTPPRMIESIVAQLIPPARREEVLGDLHERYRGPTQYLLEALRTVPHVVRSHVARTVDPRLVIAEAFSLYFGFLMGRPNWRGAFFHRTMLAYAIPSTVALVAFVFLYAYVPQGRRTSVRLALCSAIAVAIAFGMEQLVRLADPRLALTGRPLLMGAVAAGFIAWSAAEGKGMIYMGKPDR